MSIYRGYLIKRRMFLWQVWHRGKLVYSTPYEQAALQWIDDQYRKQATA
jgi:hypothetical protein